MVGGTEAHAGMVIELPHQSIPDAGSLWRLWTSKFKSGLVVTTLALALLGNSAPVAATNFGSASSPDRWIANSWDHYYRFYLSSRTNGTLPYGLQLPSLTR